MNDMNYPGPYIPDPFDIPDLFDPDDEDPHMYPDDYDWAYEDEEGDVDDEED